MNSPINLTEWPHEKIKSKKILELAEEVLHSNEYVGNYFKFDKDWFKYDRYCGSASLSLTSKKNNLKRYVYDMEVVNDMLISSEYNMQYHDNPFNLFKIILTMCYHRKYYTVKEENNEHTV
jgi:hypothetical protein